jgi:hypothetical protein
MSDEQEPFVEIVDRMALVDVHPRAVPQEALLRALLAQNGHYVASEVVDLMQLSGVAPRGGYAILVSGSPPAVDLPTGYVRRELDGHTAFFFCEDDRFAARRALARSVAIERSGKRPWKKYVPDPAVLAACEAACARWTLDWSIEPGSNGPHFPWGSFTRLTATSATREQEIWTSAAVHHAWLYEIGSESGVAAVAAGRLEQAGCVPLAVVGARWMFDLEES